MHGNGKPLFDLSEGFDGENLKREMVQMKKACGEVDQIAEKLREATGDRRDGGNVQVSGGSSSGSSSSSSSSSVSAFGQ